MTILISDEKQRFDTNEIKKVLQSFDNGRLIYKILLNDDTQLTISESSLINQNYYLNPPELVIF